MLLKCNDIYNLLLFVGISLKFVYVCFYCAMWKLALRQIARVPRPIFFYCAAGLSDVFELWKNPSHSKCSGNALEVEEGGAKGRYTYKTKTSAYFTKSLLFSLGKRIHTQGK